jgi:hypothetical protein
MIQSNIWDLRHRLTAGAAVIANGIWNYGSLLKNQFFLGTEPQQEGLEHNITSAIAVLWLTFPTLSISVGHLIANS